MLLLGFLVISVVISGSPAHAEPNQQASESSGLYVMRDDLATVSHVRDQLQKGVDPGALGLRRTEGTDSAAPRRSLDELRAEGRKSGKTFQASVGKPAANSLMSHWSPPPFGFDFIQPDECRGNDTSATPDGWIKNHYAFCRVFRYLYYYRQCGRIFCTVNTLDFRVVLLGYGSDRERRARFLTIVEDFMASSPVMMLAAVNVDVKCEALVQAGDCVPDPGTPDVWRLAADWARRSSFSKNIDSTAPDATVENPNRLGFASFWTSLRVIPPGMPQQTEDGAKQTIRFDTVDYLHLNGRNGAIFSRTTPTINHPLQDPYFAPLTDAALHYEFALDHPEQTIPLVENKTIPGKLGVEPLTRVYFDRARIDRNRSTAQATCASQLGPRPEGAQCDEYPFASTHEGAAKGDNRYSVRWVNGDSNEAAGTWLGAWYSYDRILDGDFFYVRVTR